MINLQLSLEEATTLRDKLERLMTQSNPGVDVWLAPGGVLDVTGKDSNTECFLDCDEPAGDHLNMILAKLKDTTGQPGHSVPAEWRKTTTTEDFLPATFLVTLRMTVYVDKDVPHEAHPANWDWWRILNDAEATEQEGGDCINVEALPPFEAHWG